jgi:DnaK suppressor protein
LPAPSAIGYTEQYRRWRGFIPEEKAAHGESQKGTTISRCRRKDPAVPHLHCYEFRTLLQAQRRQLLEQMRDGSAPRESQELEDIEVALARIADGSYGACIDCGGEIGRARLKADPALKRCPPCQTLVNGKK